METALFHWFMVGIMSATFILAAKFIFVQWLHFGPLTTLAGAL